MTEQVSKTLFKAKALKYFRQVETTGEPLIITDRGHPTLELRPLKPSPTRTKPSKSWNNSAGRSSITKTPSNLSP
jgi:antitoxin (DNA-binding transcriptional repressor) of toxin-antitoxin stability system